MIHPLADCQSPNIGEGTLIWQFSVVLKGARIGRDCNINCHCFVENDVILSDNVTVKAGAYLWDALRVEDNVFIGPNVTFANDRYPRSKQHVDYPLTVIKKGASIGACSIILPGITIGRYALAGAGSLITKDVPDYALVYGSPARIMGWVDEKGRQLRPDGLEFISEEGVRYRKGSTGLICNTMMPF